MHAKYYVLFVWGFFLHSVYGFVREFHLNTPKQTRGQRHRLGQYLRIGQGDSGLVHVNKDIIMSSKNLVSRVAKLAKNVINAKQ